METHEIISRKTLCGCFSLLRQSLNDWQAGNLYFLNSHALYRHLSALPCGKDTVGGILTQMESCIPMALTTDSLEKFLLAKSPAEAEDFLESTKTDFLFLLLAAGKDDVLWQHVMDVCENLRQKQMDKPKERRFCYGRKTLS